jgi:methyltransferase (TIGR00027 family)
MDRRVKAENEFGHEPTRGDNSPSAWGVLIAAVQQTMDGGLTPESEEARALAWRWMRLAAASGNSGEKPSAPDSMGISPEMSGWVSESFVHARMALFAKYLEPAERDKVRSRQLAHTGEWPPLIAEMRLQCESGTKVSDPVVQALALRWQELFRASYCGENRELENKIRMAYLNEPDLMVGSGTDLSLNVFVQKAIMYSQRPKHVSVNAGPKPSALSVATLRAAHQLLDAPLVLDDPLALKILGAEDESALRANPGQHDNHMARALRTSVVVRSRLAEDEWEKAAAKGVGQYVILGAGLDTYAYRTSHRTGHIFEVDLPETQRWKRDRLESFGIRIPDYLTYVPIDFERSTLAQALLKAGFRSDTPAFFSWLGVVFYLEESAVMDTLGFISSCAPGSAVVFDYIIPPSDMTQVERIGFETLSSALARRGERMKTFLDPAELAGKLLSMGFSVANSFGPDQLNERYLSGRRDGLRLGRSARLMHAVV